MMTIKEFCTDKQSLTLKELGFDEPCFGYYVDGELRGVNLGMEELGGVKPYYERFGFHTINNHHIENKIVVTSPLKQQAFTWFREQHGLYSSIVPKKSFPDNYVTGIEWYVEICGGDGKEIGPDGTYTYEEAENACLDKLIEIVKNNQ
jgi:hypothetical protein